MNKKVAACFFGLVVAGVVITASQLSPQRASITDLPYSAFVQSVDQGTVATATISAGVPATIVGKLKDGSSYQTIVPVVGFSTNAVVEQMQAKHITIAQVATRPAALTDLLGDIMPFLILLAGIGLLRRTQGGRGIFGAMSFGRSRARLQGEDQVKVNFSLVAGCDEAKEEVGELVEFLRDPGKFERLGGKIPRGVLMVGPPGTGKTLLAKAIAGEAKVPFFSISGSDFVEMFVGVGASRVRDMFDQAKKHAPCIVFIDEIDAVGRRRGDSLSGASDERDQTLNQMLVEMDGFEGTEGIIIIAATNRPDVLDPALLRPGRFDRQVVVGLPDVKGREEILKVHLLKVPTANDVEPMVIARGTPGFSGADLANVVNEAALLAARGNARKVRMSHLDKARDKILMGTERRSMVMSESEKKLTAYHEAGHAIVGRLVPDHAPVYKVSIIPRGRALGVTMYLPENDKYSLSRRAIESQLCSLYGGRVAEELIFGTDEVTIGAANDIERATNMARNMVTKWGLSLELGPVSYGDEESSVSQQKNVSNETASKIDEVVRDVLGRAYDRSKDLLNENIDKLHAMADALLQYETIDARQIDDIMAGRVPGPPADWSRTALQSSEPPGPPPQATGAKTSAPDVQPSTQRLV